jgi:hypothetical protein
MCWLKNLHALKCGGWGVFIAPTTKMAVGRGCCRWSGAPPDTVRCASHVTQSLGFDHWSSDMWGHWTVRWCTGHALCSLSGAPSGAALTLRALSAHCSVVSRPLNSTVAPATVAPLGTPDSPVNYSRVAPQKPEASELELIHPGAPDSLVRQTRAAFGWFCSFLF